MGLGEADLPDEGDGGAAAAAVACSICLEAVVTGNGDRSWAKLQCGHQFHLDCIGSAFNIKGAMQCPNCRKIEKGQWLYANGGRPIHEFNMDDWTHDEDLYDLGYSEMSFGVHWCPFSGLARVPSSFDEGNFSSSAYHDLLRHHAVFPEHTPVSSTTPCPYVAYIGPVHPSSSASSGSVSDGSNFSNHWNGPAVPNEVLNSYAFPSPESHYHSWDHSSPFATNNRVGGSEQPLIPSLTQRTARNSSDIPRTGMHPFIIGHSSASRAPSSVTSTVFPPYPGTTPQPRDRPSSLQAYYHQSTNHPGARTPLGRRSTSHRGLAQGTPIASSSDQSSGFYFFSSNSSGRFQESENPFHAWEREHQPSFFSSQHDRDSIWGPFPPPGSRQRHGSERMTPQHRS